MALAAIFRAESLLCILFSLNNDMDTSKNRNRTVSKGPLHVTCHQKGGSPLEIAARMSGGFPGRMLPGSAPGLRRGRPGPTLWLLRGYCL
jgi:hypothetical protein